MATCPDCGTSYPRHIQICPRDGTVLQDDRTDDPLIGRTLDGKYRVESRVGEGGMGTVYRATHLMLGKPVALKLIKPELVTSKEIARRFQREARAASHLNHPGIATVYDLGQSEDGTLYIAMEFVEGPSLKDVLASGPLPPDRIVRIVRQIATALGAAHDRQIVHRDLKPQNVVLTMDAAGRELAKLLDFGIAKTFDDGATRLTSTGIVVGTPQYMSPEQASGSPVDARSDLYSLGIIIYEMLTGDVPFTAPTTLALLVKQLQDAPVAPSHRRPDLEIAPALESLALTCLAKDPANRCQTADEVVQALESVAPQSKPFTPAADAALAAPTVVLSDASAAKSLQNRPTVLVPAGGDASHRGGRSGMRGRRAFVWLAGAVVVLLFVGAGYLSGWWRSAPPAAPGARESLSTIPPDSTLAPPSDDVALRAELALWDATRGSSDPALFDSFVARYPTSQFRPIAETRAAELRRGAARAIVPSGAAPPSPAPATAAVQPPPASTATPTLQPPPTPETRSATAPPPPPPAPVDPPPSLRWARIPAGTFEMGCVPGDPGCAPVESPRRSVLLTRAYELMTTEVTVGTFRAYAAAAGRAVPAQPAWNSDSRHPIVNVAWDEADAICRAMGARLATEAEWERAARGGVESLLYEWGNTGRPTGNLRDETYRRKFPGESGFFLVYDDGYLETAPVGSYSANRYGLFDMAGNVSEWVADRMGPYADGPVRDPHGPDTGDRHVLRGGSFMNPPRILRLSARGAQVDGYRADTLGFRCARDVAR